MTGIIKAVGIFILLGKLVYYLKPGEGQSST